MNRVVIIVFLCIYREGNSQEIESLKAPDIKYCYSNSIDWPPSSHCSNYLHISNGAFVFGNVFQKLLDIDDSRIIPADAQVLVLKCTAAYPIRWIARKPVGSIWLVNGTKGANKDIYIQELSIPIKFQEFSSYLRCQSFESPNQTADIYLNRYFSFLKKNVPAAYQIENGSVWNIFDVDSSYNASSSDKIQLTVPCVSHAAPGYLKFARPNIPNDVYDYIRLHQAERLTINESRVDHEASNSTYDPRVGFLIETSKNTTLKSNFACTSKQLQSNDVMTPVSSGNKINASLEILRHMDSQSRIICHTPENDMEVRIKFGACNSILECDLKWKPLEPHVFSVVNTTVKDFDVVPLENEEIYYTSPNGIKLDYSHGFIHCCGLRAKYDSQDESGELEFVSEMNYMFTGLNGKTYFTSEVSGEHNEKKVISFKEVEISEDDMKHIYVCNISTFFLLSNIEFLIYLSDPLVARDPISLRPGRIPSGLRATIQQLRPEKRKAIASWRLELHEPIETDNVANVDSVVCKAPYINANKMAKRVIKPKPVTPSRRTEAIGITVATVMFTVLIMLLVLICMKYKTAVNQIRNLSRDEVDEFYFGNNKAPQDDDEIALDRIPFANEKIIRSEHLLIEETVLGEGQFGIVQRGTLNGQSVAVKSSKSTADIEYFKAFLKEIKLMAYIGEHDNVVQFCGAVVDKIQERLCFAVIELCPFGNLNSYLRAHSKGYSDKNVELSENSTSETETPEVRLSKNILMSFCRQIATGMEFLSQKRVIHGDLATRNVLVFDNNIVKITDFGLSRKLYNCANYTKTHQAPLPWRWMAIESLRFPFLGSHGIRTSWINWNQDIVLQSLNIAPWKYLNL
ncbi:unnamed protein product [Allacma fusca]|uniref:Protein kinase domain-containing protein n=1 Tax=Allacma fusca TaxID=39272 RepID=A0A8J2KTV8_9HEXA|nr:unnamed protein product [Allacma fusca]